MKHKLLQQNDGTNQKRDWFAIVTLKNYIAHNVIIKFRRGIRTNSESGEQKKRSCMLPEEHTQCLAL